jgi:hypothetical protein
MPTRYDTPPLLPIPNALSYNPGEIPKRGLVRMQKNRFRLVLSLQFKIIDPRCNSTTFTVQYIVANYYCTEQQVCLLYTNVTRSSGGGRCFVAQGPPSSAVHPSRMRYRLDDAPGFFSTRSTSASTACAKRSLRMGISNS